MELSIDTSQDSASIRLTGEIDEKGSQILKENFLSLDKSIIKHVILDFSKVTHIGSAGIGKLLLFYKDIAIAGGKIQLINVPDSIYTLFLTLKLNSVFDILKA